MRIKRRHLAVFLTLWVVLSLLPLPGRAAAETDPSDAASAGEASLDAAAEPSGLDGAAAGDAADLSGSGSATTDACDDTDAAEPDPDGAAPPTTPDDPGPDDLDGLAAEEPASTQPTDGPEAEPYQPLAAAVRVAETARTYDTLHDAIAGAQGDGLGAFTLEVIGDTAEGADVIITSDVTLVSAEGSHTVTFLRPNPFQPLLFTVQSGGSLVLGDGIGANTLTISYGLTVTDGSVLIRDGASIVSGGIALSMDGPSATGTIIGGRLQGELEAIDIRGQSHISLLSGGEFYAKRDVVHVSDAGTRIELISGGTFHQTDPDITLHGHALFVQNQGSIGEISGGHFEALRNFGLVVTRGGWVGEISGGEFKINRVGSISDNTATAAVWIEGDVEGSGSARTGIGTISGGHFSGGYFGVLTIRRDAIAYIDSITGGTFEGVVGLQNDNTCRIQSITGGTFEGSHGILNVSWIGEIGGQAILHGKSLYGLFNFSGSTVDKISGGWIISDDSNAIANSGTIHLISGGVIDGCDSAINCDGINKGRLYTITGGVFRAEYFECIRLSSQLTLEPGIDTLKGAGRYVSRYNSIFNNESLVVYPQHAQTGAMYHMSTATEAVEGITGTEFHYLTFELPDGYGIVTVVDSYAAAADTGAGIYAAGETVTIKAGSREGYTFAGWTTDDGVTLADAAGATTTFQMPDHDVTVTATWVVTTIPEPTLYKVTVIGSHAPAAETGAGDYAAGAAVTIQAGTRDGYTFAGWTTGDGLGLADPRSATTTFQMPARDVTVTATWTANSPSRPPTPTPQTPPTGDALGAVSLGMALALTLLGLACLSLSRLRRPPARH